MPVKVRITMALQVKGQLYTPPDSFLQFYKGFMFYYSSYVFQWLEKQSFDRGEVGEYSPCFCAAFHLQAVADASGMGRCVCQVSAFVLIWNGCRLTGHVYVLFALCGAYLTHVLQLRARFAKPPMHCRCLLCQRCCDFPVARNFG